MLVQCLPSCLQNTCGRDINTSEEWKEQPICSASFVYSGNFCTFPLVNNYCLFMWSSSPLQITPETVMRLLTVFWSIVKIPQSCTTEQCKLTSSSTVPYLTQTYALLFPSLFVFFSDFSIFFPLWPAASHVDMFRLKHVEKRGLIITSPKNTIYPKSETC